MNANGHPVEVAARSGASSTVPPSADALRACLTVPRWHSLTFDTFHTLADRLTPGLDGAGRRELFEQLPARLQRTAWVALGRKAGSP